MTEISVYMNAHVKTIQLPAVYIKNLIKGVICISYEFDENNSNFIFKLQNIKRYWPHKSTQRTFNVSESRLKLKSLTAWKDLSDLHYKGKTILLNAMKQYLRDNPLYVELIIPDDYKYSTPLSFNIRFNKYKPYFTGIDFIHWSEKNQGISDLREFFEKKHLDYMEQNFS